MLVVIVCLIDSVYEKTSVGTSQDGRFKERLAGENAGKYDLVRLEDKCPWRLSTFRFTCSEFPR